MTSGRDPLSAVRGVFHGLLLSALLYAAIGGVVLVARAVMHAGDFGPNLHFGARD